MLTTARLKRLATRRRYHRGLTAGNRSDLTLDGQPIAVSTQRRFLRAIKFNALIIIDESLTEHRKMARYPGACGTRGPIVTRHRRSNTPVHWRKSRLGNR